ncbi:methylenetetrahydrofolate reductase isoform X2 [Trichogramma pretiosum]|uniref:methylenetetrahydrofolate reductase isoform X2 n=1 Tax=Trichogramma pretiosum TaxID=7493 RepID=UPI0006C97AAC|nr:methylenetetrahydrofolate reductase isoform X2 [Trichogramma pretiosum]
MRRQVLLLDQSLTSSDKDDDNIEGDCRRADIVDRPSTVAATESVNLACSIESKIRNKDYFCSYELFPTDVPDVYHRFFQVCKPLFYALTWHDDYNTIKLDKELGKSLKCVEKFPANTLLHLVSKGLTRNLADEILNYVLRLGIVNIFILQGDTSSQEGDFIYASDLVSFVRDRFGRRFSICVAGYPEMHQSSLSKELDLFYLKNKVESGADFIITQVIFESRVFTDFVNDCHAIGIKVPIIPGLFPFETYRELERMTKLCKVKIPSWLSEKLLPIGDDDEAVRRLGVEITVKIIKEMRLSGISYGYHLFTLNRSKLVCKIHKQLNTDGLQ